MSRALHAALCFVLACASLPQPPARAAEFLPPNLKPVSVPPERRREINAAAPPQSPPVVKSADLEKSAIGQGFTPIPLPAFTYNRNEGSWIGGLVPIFRANEKGEVEDIFAPLYLHNKLIGETFTFNYFGYRNKTTQYHAVLSLATKVERTVDLSYKNTAASDGDYLLSIQANSGKSAFNRFFGFGNNAVDRTETTYTMGDSNLKLAGGVNITPELTLIATERYRQVSIENGVSPTLLQTRAAFPDIPGIDGANILGHSLTLAYDSRDNQLTPLRGTNASLFAEYDENVKTSERNRWWRLTGEAKKFFPHDADRMVFVVHALVDGVIGQEENSSVEDTIEQDTGLVDAQGNPILLPFLSKRLVRRGVPFYERPSLGGETTLRGFGRGRFVSNFAWLLNLEERISLMRRAIMGNVIEVEVAPFVDIGRVGRSLNADGIINNAQINPGVGLRVLARPNIAGRLDVARGRDGMAVYVGLDYPF